MVALNNSQNDNIPSEVPSGKNVSKTTAKPSAVQLKYLRLGVDQPGGKLPLFDADGQEIKPATIRSCVEKGWAEPWFNNPTMPNWIVCKLTDLGRKAAK